MNDLYPLLMTPLFDPAARGAGATCRPFYSQRFSEKIRRVPGLREITARCKMVHLQESHLPSWHPSTSGSWWEMRPKTRDRFPLLAKFLFPQEKLSVQVSPG